MSLAFFHDFADRVTEVIWTQKEMRHGALPKLLGAEVDSARDYCSTLPRSPYVVTEPASFRSSFHCFGVLSLPPGERFNITASITLADSIRSESSVKSKTDSAIINLPLFGTAL